MYIYKKMKQHKAILGAALIMSTMFSCNEDDVLGTTPDSEVVEDSFITDDETLEIALIGAYDSFQRTYNEGTLTWGSFRSDNFALSLTNRGANNITSRELVNNRISPANGFTNWVDIFQIIERSNRVIDNSEGLDPSIRAEALALRAKAYFDAIRIWGDVPFFNGNPSGVNSIQRNVTGRDTIMNELILPDLREASRTIIPTTNPFRFSKASILALQAEVFLWEGENALAKSALDSIVALGEFSLANSPGAWEDMFFNDPSTRGKIQTGTELIFSIPNSLNEEAASLAQINRLLSANGAPVVLSPDLEAEWDRVFPLDSTWEDKYPDVDPFFTREVSLGGGVTETEPLYGDWRYYLSREGREENFASFEPGEARVAKWSPTPNMPGNNVDDTDLVVYRYADVLLLLAEAELKLGNSDRALEILNDIRTERQLPLVAAEDYGTTFDDRLNAILTERRFELFAEGKRWWDLLRNDRAIEELNPILSQAASRRPLTDDLLFWPINTTVLINNTLLTQNDGY